MRISVYIPSYNQRPLLKEAIESVVNQTLPPYEIIIVDDGSNDGSQDLISDFAKEYSGLIRPVFFEENKGVTAVRRAAIEMATGDYVTYVDGDDLFHPEKLEVESRLLEGGKYDLSFSNNNYFQGDKYDIQRIWAYNLKDMPSPGNMYLQTFCRSFPRRSLYRMELVRLEMLRKVGLHDSNLSIYEDYELRIRLSQHANINYTLAPLSSIRMDSHRLSKSATEVHLNSLNYIRNKHLLKIQEAFPDKRSEIEHAFDSFVSSLQGSGNKPGKWKKIIDKIINS